MEWRDFTRAVMCNALSSALSNVAAHLAMLGNALSNAMQRTLVIKQCIYHLDMESKTG